MSRNSIDIYLNDHMAGAIVGTEIAFQLRDRNENTPLGDLMAPIAAEIEEDRQVLEDLMDSLDVKRNPVKQAGGWMAEKWSRVKFSGAGSANPPLGNFMALESLALGVTGKRCLWAALESVQNQYPVLEAIDLERLAERATGQLDSLERARLQAAVCLLDGD